MNGSQMINVMTKRLLEFDCIEACVELKGFVCVDHHTIIYVIVFTKLCQSVTSIPGKISPWLINYNTWNVLFLQKLANDILGSIGRSGINDKNEVNERHRARKTALDAVHLIFHNHAKSDCL